MSKREKRKAKSAKKVTFASSPVYFPRKNYHSDHKHSSPQKGTVVSLLFGQFSVQIPNNYDGATVRRFGSFPRSDQSCSSDVQFSKKHISSVLESEFSGSSFGKTNVDVQNLKRPFSSVLESEIRGSSFGKANVAVETCSICLGLGHLARSCFSPIRCKSCYNYGHLARWCYTRARPKLFWKPKKSVHSAIVTNAANLRGHDDPSASLPSLETPVPNQSTVQPCPSSDDLWPAPSSTMANFDVNPVPYIPTGFDLEHWARPARGRTIVAGNPPR
jgi:hypothetical protein